MKPTIRYRQIMAALRDGEPYSAISKRYRMTLRDVWVYDSVRTRGFPRELPPKQTEKWVYYNPKKFVFSREVLAEADARHKAGESIIKIAESLHTSDTTLARAMKDAGYDTAGKKTHDEVKRQIAEDFERGVGIVAMKQKYHMCAETIRGYVREVVGNDRYDDAIHRNRCAGQARRAAERTAQRDRRLVEEAQP